MAAGLDDGFLHIRYQTCRPLLHIVSRAVVQDAVENGCPVLVDGDTRGLKKQPDGQDKDYDLEKLALRLSQ